MSVQIDRELARQMDKEEAAGRWLEADPAKRPVWELQKGLLEAKLTNTRLGRVDRRNMEIQLSFLNFHLERKALITEAIEQLSPDKRRYYDELKRNLIEQV